jgi:hypothetical protein
MTTGPLDPKEEAARAVFLAGMKVADEDPQQAARLAATCAALVAVFGGLSQSLMTARTIFHLHGLTTREMPKIEQGQFLALSLLAGTADSLARAVIALIGGGNLYAASALLRQIVEIEYLGWAFANDPDEVRNAASLAAPSSEDFSTRPVSRTMPSWETTRMPDALTSELISSSLRTASVTGMPIPASSDSLLMPPRVGHPSPYA